jgi:hypothetical protein
MTWLSHLWGVLWTTGQIKWVASALIGAGIAWLYYAAFESVSPTWVLQVCGSVLMIGAGGLIVLLLMMMSI